MINVRPARIADAEAIAAVHVRSWQVAYDGIIPHEFLQALDVASRAEQWRRNLTETETAFGTAVPTTLVAELGASSGSVVGFASLGRWRDAPDDTSLGELWAIYAHPDHWGTGAGHELMSETMRRFELGGVEAAHLWVLEDNTRARGFYERHGWTVEPVTRSEEIGGSTVVERRYSRDVRQRTDEPL